MTTRSTSLLSLFVVLTPVITACAGANGAPAASDGGTASSPTESEVPDAGPAAPPSGGALDARCTQASGTTECPPGYLARDGRCEADPRLASRISVGRGHACAVRADGAVVCWGANYDGQAAPPQGTFREVAAGDGRSCGIRTDDTIACWGQGSTPPPAGRFAHVSVGSHACAVRLDGYVLCWGGDYAVVTPPGATFRQVSVSANDNAGILTDRTVTRWGLPPWSSDLPIPAGTFEQIANCSAFVCGVRTDGTLACWGHVFASDRELATPPPGSFVQVAATISASACGLRPDSSVVCWGRAYVTSNINRASKPLTGAYRQIAASLSDICGIRVDGTIACEKVGEGTPLTPPPGTFW